MPTKRELAEENVRLCAKIEQLHQLLMVDQLTGLYSRRYLLNHLPIQEAEARRSERGDLFIIFVDIDSFKRVNDAHGHAVGDDVLTTVSQTIRSKLRLTDAAGRWGGEEILVIGHGDGFVVAERLRKAVEGVKHSGLSVTISCGVAIFHPVRDRSIDDTIRRADEAMYAAKKAGRNCSLFTPFPPLTSTPGR